MKILVADSDRTALNSTVSVLKELYPEATIVSTDDGMKAVQYSLNHPVNAVYTEVLMPHINGFNLAQLVQKFRPDAAAYIVSGTSAFLEQARERGLSGYYLKPLCPADWYSGNLLSGAQEKLTVI